MAKVPQLAKEQAAEEFRKYRKALEELTKEELVDVCVSHLAAEIGSQLGFAADDMLSPADKKRMLGVVTRLGISLRATE